MIRGIDNQMMIQQTLNASKVVGEQRSEEEAAKAFKAHLEQERVAEEANTVLETEKLEHRRIEKDQDGRSRQDDPREAVPAAKKKREKEKTDEREMQKAKLVMNNVGNEIDIDV